MTASDTSFRGYSVPESWSVDPPSAHPRFDLSPGSLDRTAPSAPPMRSTIEGAEWGDAAWIRNLARLESVHGALLDRPVREVVRAVDRVARRFLDEADSLHLRAVAEVAESAGFSSEMAQTIVVGMARDWTADALDPALRSDFREPEVLDRWIPDPMTGVTVRANGPALSLHIGAGNTPGVVVGSMVQSLLVKSTVLAKPGATDIALPMLFREALEETDPELAEAVAVVYWPGGGSGLESAAISRADQVVVYGSDRTVTEVRSRMRPAARLIAHPHRIGLVVLGRDALAPETVERSAATLAWATALFDQRGCVSPHVVFVQSGGVVGPREFAERLAEALDEVETKVPSGPVAHASATEVQQWRGRVAMREGATLFASDRSLRTVLVDAEREPAPGPGARCVHLVPIASPREALVRMGGRGPDPTVRAVHQSLGVAGVPDLDRFSDAARRMGFTRIVTVEKLPWPRAWNRHDGISPLAGRVLWYDLEGGAPPRPTLRPAAAPHAT